MGRGLLGRFGGSRDANSRWTIGQRDNLMFDDYFFYLFQPDFRRREEWRPRRVAVSLVRA